MGVAATTFNWKLTAALTAAGAVVILGGMQLIPQPEQKKVVQARPRAEVPGRDGVPNVTVEPAGDGQPLGDAYGDVHTLAGAPRVRDLFNPLVKEPEEAPPVQVQPKPTPPPAPEPPRERPREQPRQPEGPTTSDIQMMGVVELGDQIQALLRRPSTGESRYVSKGEEAFGFKVTEIKADEVVLESAGRPARVQMSTAVGLEQIDGGVSTGGAGGFGGGGFGGGGFGGGGFGGGGFGGNNGGRGNRGNFTDSGRDRGGRDRGRGDRTGGGGATGGSTGAPSNEFDLASVMRQPTWAARLKMLEDNKAKIDPARFETLHKFIKGRADQEAAK